MAPSPHIADRRLAVLFSAEEIETRIRRLAGEIASAMGEDVLLAAILKGSFVFAADLIRALHHAGMRPQIDFITLSSYRTGTESSGTVEITRDVTDAVEGRTILLIDDILESGRTVAFARNRLLGRGAADVKLCVLLDKRGKRETEIVADFVGFVCPDRFVVSYGVDYAHYLVRFFFEEEAFDDAGQLKQPKTLSINKIGHALHDRDDAFRAFSYQPALAAIALDLAEPLALQSMYIFKQPAIGGQVMWHQDSSFLHAEPESVVGLWVALEDATIENGCLWALPGGHRRGLKSRFVRTPKGAFAPSSMTRHRGPIGSSCRCRRQRARSSFCMGACLMAAPRTARTARATPIRSTSSTAPALMRAKTGSSGALTCRCGASTAVRSPLDPDQTPRKGGRLSELVQGRPASVRCGGPW